MDAKEFEQMDALLRVLYREGEQAWYHVYTKAGVSKPDADRLYKTLKADGYVRTIHKGSDFTIPDPHGVGLTDAGQSWFSKTNYVKEYVHPKVAEAVTSFVINDSKVSGLNIVSGSGNHINDRKETTSFWENSWTISIGSGLILLLLGYLISRFF